MAIWISIPILSSLVVLQSVVVSRTKLLHGTADLVMLVIIAWALQKRVKSAWHWAVVGGLLVGMVSTLPIIVPVISSILIVAVALLLKQRVWQVEILAMFVTTFIGTLLVHSISIISLIITGTTLPFLEVVSSITVPSLLLNLLIAAPAYFLLRDLAKWLYPEQLEV